MAQRAAGRPVPVRGDLRPAYRARTCTRRCCGLLPYIGLWRGRGRGGYPTIEDFDYAQEIRISHDGRPFLQYESRAWMLDDGVQAGPAGRARVGWWRPVMATAQRPTRSRR